METEFRFSLCMKGESNSVEQTKQKKNTGNTIKSLALQYDPLNKVMKICKVIILFVNYAYVCVERLTYEMDLKLSFFSFFVKSSRISSFYTKYVNERMRERTFDMSNCSFDAMR